MQADRSNDTGGMDVESVYSKDGKRDSKGYGYSLSWKGNENKVKLIGHI